MEGTLDLILAQYFCGEDNEKINLFTDEVLVKMLTFSRKQNLLSDICKKEDVDIAALKKDMDFIRDTRNKVAHHQRFWGGDETVLYPRRSWINMNTEGLELNDKLMEEMEKRTNRALQGLSKLFREIVHKKANSNKNL